MQLILHICDTLVTKQVGVDIISTCLQQIIKFGSRKRSRYTKGQGYVYKMPVLCFTVGYILVSSKMASKLCTFSVPPTAK